MGEPVRIADVARRLAELTKSRRRHRVHRTAVRARRLDEVLFGAGEVDFRPVHPLIAHVSVPPLAPVGVGGRARRPRGGPVRRGPRDARARHRTRQPRVLRPARHAAGRGHGAPAEPGAARGGSRGSEPWLTSSRPLRGRDGSVSGPTPGAPVGGAGRRLPILLASRVIEQCVLGGASLLLAARLGLDGFAPVSALLVVNSAAVTLSDYGIGLAALRCPPGETVALRSLQRMRLVNLAILAARDRRRDRGRRHGRAPRRG